jgi:hypothetical protein
MLNIGSLRQPTGPLHVKNQSLRGLRRPTPSARCQPGVKKASGSRGASQGSFSQGRTASVLGGDRCWDAGHDVRYGCAGTETLFNRRVSRSARDSRRCFRASTRMPTSATTSSRYLIQCSAQPLVTASAPETVSIAAFLNSGEVPGSQWRLNLTSDNLVGAVSNTFSVNTNAGDTLTLWLAGSSTDVRLAGTGTLRRSVSQTLIRIQ